MVKSELCERYILHFRYKVKHVPSRLLRTSCPLYANLFVVFMVRISRRSPNLRIVSLLFADDVIRWPPTVRELQYGLRQFIAECEAQWMSVRISPRLK